MQQVLFLEGTRLAAWGGAPEACCVEDLGLSLEAAARLGPWLARLPRLHTLRLSSHCGFSPDKQAVLRLGTALLAAASLAGLRSLWLGSGLYYCVQEHSGVGAAQAACPPNSLHGLQLSAYSAAGCRPASLLTEGRAACSTAQTAGLSF